jgi:phenylalanyl-tRNA synthetase alpha chain
LLIPSTHPARSKSDTYYANENTVLRTHTSAHQNELLSKGHTSFLVTGDVYRKDEIDSRHYPVFHQMEMLTLLNDKDIDPVEELKKILSGLVDYLFPKCEYRFNPDYFPFTDPSFEIEVKYQDKWLEILGCGVVQNAILDANGYGNRKAIAVGLGIDRLVMIFADIPDIRYLWSTHEKFINQFSDGKIKTFKMYSNLPSQTKDISFFVPKIDLECDVNNKQTKWLKENDFFELIRDNSDDMLEEVKLMDSFYNSKLLKYSRTYRLTYSPKDATIKNPGEFSQLCNKMQDDIRKIVMEKMDVVLR